MEQNQVSTVLNYPGFHAWNETQGYLYIQISKFPNSRHYRQNLNYLKEVLVVNKGSKMLINISDYISLSLEDQFYTSYIFIPDVIRHGVTKMAVLASENSLLRKLFIENIHGSMEGKQLNWQIFSNLEKAEEWLNVN